MELIDYLKKVDNKTLAQYWCSFNSWEFPVQLKEFQPKGWKSFSMDVMHQYLKPVSKYIRNRVPEKELLREWNKNRMNDKQFEAWWETKAQLNEDSVILLKVLAKQIKTSLN